MRHRQYVFATALLFAVVAAAHGARFVYGVPITVGDVAIPLWASGGAFVVAASLAVWGILRNGK